VMFGSLLLGNVVATIIMNYNRHNKSVVPLAFRFILHTKPVIGQVTSAGYNGLGALAEDASTISALVHTSYGAMVASSDPC